MEYLDNIIFVIVWFMLASFDAYRHSEIVNRNQNPHVFLGFIIRSLVGTFVWFYVCFMHTFFVWYMTLPFMFFGFWFVFIMVSANLTRDHEKEATGMRLFLFVMATLSTTLFILFGQLNLLDI